MTTLPSAGPLAGRWVRLDLLGEPDLDEMYTILADPAVYAHGYVMHRRPDSVADARDYLAAGYFAQGSMGPKVQAAVNFVEWGGRQAIITHLIRALDALDTGVRGGPSWTAREVCANAGAVVISVDYRLAVGGVC